MEILIGLGIFVLIPLFIYEANYLFKKMYRPEMRAAGRRLRQLTTGSGHERIDILKKKILSEIPWLNNALLNLSFIGDMERFLMQANTPHPLGAFLLLSALLFISGLLLGSVLRVNLLVIALPSLIFATLPFLYLSVKRTKRIEKFGRQLPDALELMARALKAGHAFTGGLKMVADEFKDPVGNEFRRVVDEISFGVDLPEALSNLTRRMPSEDLKLFTVSVIIQRETGGNLAEVLDNIGHLIRERFKFHGKVRALSAEGRLSAMVLIAIPLFVTGFLSVTKPDYIGLLLSDELGRILVITALVLMAFGIYVLKNMVTIKV